MSNGLFREDIVNVYGGSKRPGKPLKQKNIKGITIDWHEHTKVSGSSGGNNESEGTWIYSFADLIMNLLMFFVMLFAISSIDKDKLAVIQTALLSYQPQDKKTQVEPEKSNESAQNLSMGLSASSSPEKIDVILKQVKDLLSKIDEKNLAEKSLSRLEFRSLKSRMSNLEKIVDKEKGGTDLGDSFEVVFNAARLFSNVTKNQPDNAQLSAEGLELISQLMSEINAIVKPLRLAIEAQVNEGDAISEKAAFELSSARATQVLLEMKRRGLKKQNKVGVSGLGFTEKQALLETIKTSPSTTLGVQSNVTIFISLLKEGPKPKPERQTTQ